jgi:hypothetical protein
MNKAAQVYLDRIAIYHGSSVLAAATVGFEIGKIDGK